MSKRRFEINVERVKKIEVDSAYNCNKIITFAPPKGKGIINALKHNSKADYAKKIGCRDAL